MSRARHLASTVLVVVGALVVGFVVYQVWVSDVTAARAQDELAAEMESRLVQAASLSSGAAGSSTVGFGESIDLLAEATTVPDVAGQLEIDAVALLEERSYEVRRAVEPSRTVLPGMVVRTEPAAGTTLDAGGSVTIVLSEAAPGTPVAALEIPAIGVRQVVVEGTAPEQQRGGPGHLRTTPLPGEEGNSVLLGHRTLFGAPFERLGELTAGDEIRVVTLSGAFTYVVDDTRIVEPGDRDPTGPTTRDLLTLVTANPAYRADDQLVVHAELEGTPVAPGGPARAGAAPIVADRPASLEPSEGGREGAAAAWVGVLLWGELLIIGIAATRLLYRRWLRWPTWMLTTPVLAMVTLLFYESLSGLLPSTL